MNIHDVVNQAKVGGAIGSAMSQSCEAVNEALAVRGSVSGPDRDEVSAYLKMSGIDGKENGSITEIIRMLPGK